MLFGLVVFVTGRVVVFTLWKGTLCASLGGVVLTDKLALGGVSYVVAIALNSTALCGGDLVVVANKHTVAGRRDDASIADYSLALDTSIAFLVTLE